MSDDAPQHKKMSYRKIVLTSRCRGYNHPSRCLQSTTTPPTATAFTKYDPPQARHLPHPISSSSLLFSSPLRSSNDKNYNSYYFSMFSSISKQEDIALSSSSSLSSKQEEEKEEENTVLVYQSPFGSPITRLRTVSIFSSVASVIGIPILMYLKYNNIVIFPMHDAVQTAAAAVAASSSSSAAAAAASSSTSSSWIGMIAFASTATIGTVSSTAAVHFVFSPYVYQIEQIPIRKCAFANEMKQKMQLSMEDTSTTTTTTTNEATTNTTTSNNHHSKNMILKITTRSLFLFPIETFFDPYHVLSSQYRKIEPYRGLRPLCNIVIGTVPMYIHPEHVHHPLLRQQLQLDSTDPNIIPHQTQQQQRRYHKDDDDSFF
jgi:hypothetical protein